ncbi:hypothetical protein DICPUDRAFT_17436, partial [Dictyostelium purpureum]
SEEIYFDDGTEEFSFIADMDLPTKLLNITATDIFASAYHSALLNDKNEFYHWGLFSNIVSEAPNVIEIKDNNKKNNKIKDASLGGNFILMLTIDNDLYSMGKGSYGVLGLDKEMKDLEVEPKRIETLKNRNIISLSSGYEHSIVTTDKGLFSWGRSDKGQLANGELKSEIKDQINYSSKPQFIKNSDSTFRNIKKVCSGSDHSLVLNKDGTVYSWGHGYFGATGLGKKDNVATPTKIQFNKELENKLVLDIACGGYHSLILTSDNEIYSFGWGEYGQLGHSENDTKNYYSPKKIESINSSTKIKSVFAGSHATSFYVDEKGDVYSWGWGEGGTLGFGDNQNVYVPTQVKSLSNIKKIAAGFKHTLALTNDNQVYVFGDNTFGQLGSKQNNVFEDPQNDNQDDSNNIINKKSQYNININNHNRN